MKFYRGLPFIVKSLFSAFFIYTIFTKFNVYGYRDLVLLIREQLLNPFLKAEGEQLSFIKVISLLGLYFNNFYYLISMVSDLSSGAKEIICYHSESQMGFDLKVLKLLSYTYFLEYATLILSLFGISWLLFHQLDLSPSVLALLFSWFLVDGVFACLTALISSSSVLSLLLFFMLNLVRYFLLPYPYIPVVVMCLIFYIHSRKEMLDVKNSKRL